MCVPLTISKGVECCSMHRCRMSRTAPWRGDPVSGDPLDAATAADDLPHASDILLTRVYASLYDQ